MKKINTERMEIRLSSFDKMFMVAMSNRTGKSIGALFRDLVENYRSEVIGSLSDQEYKELLDYMLLLSQR